LIAVHLHIRDRDLTLVNEESTARSHAAAAASITTRSSLSYAILERQVLNGDVPLSNKETWIVAVAANDEAISFNCKGI
jgi:hypothetical protein